MYTLRDAQIAYDNQADEEYDEQDYTGDIIINLEDGSSVLFEYVHGYIECVSFVDSENIETYFGSLYLWKHDSKLALIDEADRLANL